MRYIIILLMMFFSSNAYAQETRAQLNTYNNTNITTNGRGAITGAIVNSMNSQLITGAGILNDVNTYTPTAPVWGTNYGVYNGASFNVGGFPLTTIYTGGNPPNGATPAGASLTGAILVPANDTGIFQHDGIAGYAGNLSANPAVGVFGWGFVFGQTNLAQIWGFNSGFSNNPYFFPLTQTGFNFNQGYGGEFDVNITKLPSGAAPAGTAFGVSIAGGSEIVPTGGAYALYINSYMRSGLYGWSAAINIAASPNAYGIYIGANAVSGNSLSSQTLTFVGVNSSGGAVTSSLFANSLGSLIAQVNGAISMQLLSGSFFQYSPNASFITNISTDNSGNSSLISSGNFVVNAGATKPFAVEDASVAEFLVSSGFMLQYSPNASFVTNYSTDNFGNTTFTNGAAGDSFTFKDGAGVAQATIGSTTSFFPYSPAWGTNYGAYNGVLVNVNSFPAVGIFTNGAAGSTPTASALTGAILIPSTDTGTFIEAGVSGYAANRGSNRAAVGLFGASVILSGSSSPNNWGMNTVATNTPVLAPSTGTGFDFGAIYSVEADVNIFKKAGGVTPAGTVRGLSIFSGSEVLPTGGAYGIEIGPFILGGTQGWSAALVIDSAPNTSAISIGSNATSGNNLGSQQITFNSINGSGTTAQDAIFADSSADFIAFTPGTTTLFVVQNSSSNEFTIGNGATSINTASISAPNLPTSAGTGGLYLCVDSTGKEYKKAACP